MTEAKKTKKVFFSATNEKLFSAIKVVIAALIALAITFVILCFLTEDPLSSFITILVGPLRRARYFGVVLEKMVPYAFAGLSCGILFKAGFFNLGAEGIFEMVGVVVAGIGVMNITSSFLHPLLCILLAGLVGGVLMMIPSFFRAKFNSNEMVLSLMLNTIYVSVATYLISEYNQHPTASIVGSKEYTESALIPYIFPKFHISICFFMMIAAVIILEIMLKKSRLGYQIRLTGTNPRFAEYSGINSFKLSMSTAFISGVLAGIGSACQLLTQTTFYIPGSSVAGIGFSGCLLAMLGQNDPIGIVFSAFFIQYLEQGTRVLYMTTQAVPPEIVAIVEGIMVLLISSKYFLEGYRKKKLLKEELGKQ